MFYRCRTPIQKCQIKKNNNLFWTPFWVFRHISNEYHKSIDTSTHGTPQHVSSKCFSNFITVFIYSKSFKARWYLILPLSPPHRKLKRKKLNPCHHNHNPIFPKLQLFLSSRSGSLSLQFHIKTHFLEYSHNNRFSASITPIWVPVMASSVSNLSNSPSPVSFRSPFLFF
jgi:hypothetical protein